MALREAGRGSGVPFNVIRRFLNGAEITSDTFDALSAWVETPLSLSLPDPFDWEPLHRKHHGGCPLCILESV
jgi:hypothetical protein